MCALGYNVAESPTNTFWASDLMHRLYHMPAVGGAYIEHYAEDYAEVIELAAGNETYSTHDSDTLQYFALEVYAYDIAVPGVGCPGPRSIAISSQTATATAAPAPSSSATAVAATTTSGTPTVSQSPSTTSSLPEVSRTSRAN